MAHERTSSQRRLVTVSRLILIAALATSALLACAPDEPTGWLAPEPVGRLVVPAGTRKLEIEVRLPAGFEAAEDFAQRATLRLGPTERMAERTDLSEPFTIDLPSGDSWPDGPSTLELMLGFCEPAAKEICYIDIGSIVVEPARDGTPAPSAAGGGDAFVVIYRPESPL